MPFTFGQLIILTPDKDNQQPNNQPASDNILDKLADQFKESEVKRKIEEEIKQRELTLEERNKAISDYFTAPPATKANKKLADSKKIVPGNSFVVKNSKYIEELMNSRKR